MAKEKNVLHERQPSDPNSRWDGLITDIVKVGFHWEANWYDEHNREARKLFITIDAAKNGLSFIEHGSSGAQTWIGSYQVDEDGDTVAEGQDSTHQYMFAMNITLPKT